MTSPITLLPAEAQAQIWSSSKIVTLNDVVVGLLRNALDAGASKVTVDINHRRRSCTIEDDGLGIPPAEFRTDGGLGKLHYTSKHDSLESIYGRHGGFLSALAALSLLTITSRHQLHRSHNSITLHQSSVIARHLPAPSHHELSFRSHGTKVSVRDLFGNMPVRIKYWALVSERHGDISNEWRALKKEVVALLLAWGREVNIVVRDAEHDKKFVLRWPSSEEAFSQCLDRLRATPSTSVALTRSVLAQALKMPPRFYESWVPVSASSSSLAISGAISLEPVPTRHFQFIAFGIEPLSSDNEYVTLFHTINTIFASSTFGNLEDGSMPEEDQEMLPEMRDSGMERSKQKIGSKGKGIDRWPMFFLRITPQDGQMASKLDAAQLGVNSELTLAVIEVLQATATQFLKTTGLEPRLPRVRAEPRPSALARESISTSHRSLAERHDSDQSVAIESGANPTHNLPNNESSQCRSAQASDRLGQNPDSRVRQKRFRLDDLGGGVSLPVFAGDVPYNLSSDPSTWSRMKTSKRDKCIPIRPRRATSLARTDAVPGGGKSAATNSPRLKLSSLNKQSATEIYAHGATQRSSETTDTEPRTATTQSPSVAVEGELTSANSNHLPAIDEEVTCIHPKTKVAVRYNRRTGNMARQDEERLRLSSNSIRDGHAGSDSQTPGAGKQASPTLAGQGKGQDIKSSTWFQNVLEGWENPIFCPPERPVLQVRSGSMSLAETAANPPAAYQGSSFLNVRPSDAGIDKSSLFRLSRTALREAKVISQFDGKFILVKVKCRDEPEETESNSSRKETLVAIDQHAADERCRIEELFAELCAEAPDEHGVLSGARYRSRIKTTVLDKPINFEVDESESRLFEASAAYFARWGILYDILPPSTPPRTARGREERRVAVRTIPAGVVERCKAEPNLLIDLLRREIWAREESGLIRRVHSVSSSDVDRPTSHPVDEVDPEHMDVDDDGRGWLRQIKDCPRGMMDLLNSRACRSAIMFNDRLSRRECRALVARLARCVLPFQCAHGRPTMFPIVDMDLGNESLAEAMDAGGPSSTRTVASNTVPQQSSHGLDEEHVRPDDDFMGAFRRWRP